MALTSPRWSSDVRLNAAAVNNPPMNWGEVGDPVRMIQQALIELGFSMPISTQRFGSPDGIFGDETKAVVTAFQRRNGLFLDGVVGQQTLGKLDALVSQSFDLLPDIDESSWVRFRFRIAFRSGALPQVPEDTALQNARNVYGQYGFRVDEGPGMSILITPQQQVALDADKTQCTLNHEDDLQKLLFSLGGGRTGVQNTDILVFYINKLTDTSNNLLNGCASHKISEPAIAAAAGGTGWTVAHEVGHCLLGNLLPTHSTFDWNLMFQSTNQIKAALPGLTEVQIRQMRRSNLVSPV